MTMESYSSLLEKIRVPQPSLQKFAVISIFEKLRSAPPHLDANSGPGRQAISQCLCSTSPAVVDESVRELCRLVMDSKLDISRALLELQSTLEETDSCFVSLFVKALGLLVCVGFRRNSSSVHYNSLQEHPFVMVLSCRAEVQSELLRQVHRFVVQNKHMGMREVCEFIRPLLNFSIIMMSSVTRLSSFVYNLASSMVSLACSFPQEAMPIVRLLLGCLKYFSCKTAEDFTIISNYVECVVDAYAEVLRQLVGMGLLIHEAQLCGVELLETIIPFCTNLLGHFGGSEAIFQKSRHLLAVMKDLGLSYSPKLSSVVFSLFTILVQSELEHEQLTILKLLLFLLRWRSENGHGISQVASELNGELLYIFPVINLMSYPSKFIKQAANDLLRMLERFSLNILVPQKAEQIKNDGVPHVSRLEHVIFRLVQYLWFQDQHSSSKFLYLNLLPISGTGAKDVGNNSKTWTYLLREYFMQIVERKKSCQPISQSQDIFLREMSLTVAAIATVLVMHQTLGCSAMELLAFGGTVDPKLGVSLLLLILYFSQMFSGKDKQMDFHDILCAVCYCHSLTL